MVWVVKDKSIGLKKKLNNMKEFFEMLNKYKEIGMSKQAAFQSMNNLQINILKKWIVKEGFATYEEIATMIRKRLLEEVDETIEILKKKQDKI